jgi:hypothetical protein
MLFMSRVLVYNQSTLFSLLPSFCTLQVCFHVLGSYTLVADLCIALSLSLSLSLSLTPNHCQCCGSSFHVCLLEDDQLQSPVSQEEHSSPEVPVE